MDISTGLLVFGGAAVLGIGGWGWFNWNRRFKQVAPPVKAKAKRKYTKKAKVEKATPAEPNMVPAEPVQGFSLPATATISADDPYKVLSNGQDRAESKQ